MKKCYYSQKNTVLRYTILFLSVIESIVLIALGLILWEQSINVVLLCCILIAFGLLINLYGVFHFLILNRGYELNSQGISIQYTKKKKLFYPWDEITQVCICEIHRSANGATKDIVIWCTIGSIVNGPPDPSRRWNSSEYELSHFRSVLTVEFSPDRLIEFKKFVKGNISDYR